MGERRRGGVLVGLAHPSFDHGLFNTEEKLDEAIQADWSIRNSFALARSELKRLPANSTVLIESPKLNVTEGVPNYSIFYKLAREAKGMGHTVVAIPYSRMAEANAVAIRMREAMEEGWGGLQTLEKKKKVMRLVKERLQHEFKDDFGVSIRGLSRKRLLRGLMLGVETMTDSLILRALKHQPSLVIAGADHIQEAKRWLPEYDDKTPEHMQKEHLQTHTGIMKIPPDLAEKLAAHRDRIVARYSGQKRGREGEVKSRD